MYDASSTIPPVHLFILYSIPIVKCTTLHPSCRLFIYYPIVKCRTLHPCPLHAPCPLFICYPNSHPHLSNVRRFIQHPLCSSTIPISKFTRLHSPSPSSTIPIVKRTTPHPPSRLFIYYPIVKYTTLLTPSRLFI